MSDDVDATRRDMLEQFRRDQTERGARRSSLLALGPSRDGQVHGGIFVSTNSVPAWPHRCGTATEGCLECTPSVSMWSRFPTVEAYSLGDGPDEPDEYRPFAMTWLDEHGMASIEVIGQPVRPELDLPSQLAPPLSVDERLLGLIDAGRETRSFAALGDELMQRRDLRAAPFESPHADRAARSWLGAFDRHVPRLSLRVENGVPSEIGLWLADTNIDVDARLPWAFGPRVRFLPRSARVIWRQLAHCRALGLLGDAELARIGELGPFAAEEVTVEEGSVPRLMDIAAALPNLRVLKIRAHPRHGMLALTLSMWDRLRTLARLEVMTAYVDVSEHTRDIATWRDQKLPFPITVAMYDEPAEVASGWAVRIEGDRTSITRVGFHPDADDTWRRIISPIRVENVASRFWAPPERVE